MASRSIAGRDLESASDCLIARIIFIEAEDHKLPIVALPTRYPLACALSIKHHILSFDSECEDAFRIEYQELDSIAADTEGTLYILEAAAEVKGKYQWPLAIFALTIPEDQRVRWYWMAASPSTLLKGLEDKGLLGQPQAADVGTTLHKRLFTTLKMLFEQAIAIPHSPDFLKAESSTDYSAEIEDPDTAAARVYNHPFIYYNAKEPWRDMSDDRYLLKLHPAERWIASMVDVRASKYMLIKREYFRSFFRDMTLNRDTINVPASMPQHQRAAAAAAQHRRNARDTRDTEINEDMPIYNTPDAAEREVKPGHSSSGKPTRVRTEKAHIDKLRRSLGWDWSRARLMVEGWKVLGLFKEERYVDWIDRGGQYETIGLRKV